MKNIKKILVALSLVALLCVGIVLVATAEGEDPHVCTADELANAQTLLDAVELVQDADSGFWNTATAKTAINKVKAAIKGHDLSAFDGYTDFIAKFNSVSKDVDAAVEANKNLLGNEAELSEYDNFTPIMVEDFEDGDEDFAIDGNFTEVDKSSIVKEETNNYLVMNYFGKVNAYHQYQLTSFDMSKGFVLEFDFTTHGELPSDGFKVENGSLTALSPTSKKAYPIYLVISKDGKVTNNTGKVLCEEAIVAGEWTHFAFVYNPSDFTLSFYINYEPVGTYSACSNAEGDSGNFVYTYVPSAIRFSAATVGTWSIDNVKNYLGTHIIDEQKFNKMGDDEKFVYFVQYLSDETKVASGRRSAYNNAKELIGKYWDGSNYLTTDAELKAGVDKFNAYDPDAIAILISNENRDKFVALVDELALVSRSLDNVKSRLSSYTDISNFLTACGTEITDDSAYDRANDKLRTLNNEIYTDLNINAFIRAMARFDMVDSLKARKKYHSTAKALTADESYPIGQSFYEKCKADYEANPEDESFLAFITAYERYLEAGIIVDQHQLRNNSQAIISCVAFIDDYYDAPDEWFTEENYDYINRYILILRDIVQNQGYDEEYEGIDEAMEIYEVMNFAFYDYLQLQHVAEISKYLELIAGTDSFIEKMGMCSYITRYFNEKDIDFTRDDIKALKINHETYLAELSHRENDYADVLVQNSHYFNNLVEKMLLAEGYEEKKALFDEANTYYFTLDASVEGTQEMIDAFDGYGDVLNNIVSSSNQFLVDVAILVAESTADIVDEAKVYEALVNCYDSSRYAETYFEGVAEAREIFDAAAAAYIEFANTANSEILSASGAIASVRANSGVSSIVAIAMEKIFG